MQRKDVEMEKIKLIDFQKRKFSNCFVAIYIVTKNIKIRTDTCITNKKLYFVFGLDFMGYRQVFGMYFDNENDTRFWLEKFEDFQARNLKDILFLITPPNKNIERAVKIIYNSVQIIHSPDSTFESITKFWADHPSRKMKIALKDLFLVQDYERYQINLEMFKNIYVDNHLILMMLDKMKQEMETFYQYPHQLRALFYPFYTIHEMKKFLNKLKTKEPLCSNINEVVEFCLPYVNSFEMGRNYSKKEWLDLISFLYDKYQDSLEEYLNG